MAYSSRFIQRWWLPALGSRANNHPILSSFPSPSDHHLLLQYPYFQSPYDAPRLADSVAKHALFSSTAKHLAILSREHDYVGRASLQQSALKLKDWLIGKVPNKTDESNHLGIVCQNKCCQEFHYLGGKALVKCTACSKPLCRDCMENGGICTGCCIIDTKKNECSTTGQRKEMRDKQFLQGYSSIQMIGNTGFRGSIQRPGCPRLSTSATYGCPATASLALDCIAIALHHDHDDGRPVNDFSYDAFKERYQSEANLIKRSDEVSAKLKARSDLVSIVDTLESVLRNFNDKSEKPYWKQRFNPCLVTKVRRNLEELIKAERDGTANSENEFFWSTEKPLNHSEYEHLQSQSDGLLDIRKEDRAICSFYCVMSKGGGYLPPARFNFKGQLSMGQNMRRRRDLALYAARCIFDSLWLDHNEKFRSYLSKAQQNASDEISTEEKKGIILKYLWDQGIVKRNVIPSFCLPTDDFSLNAREGEKEAFYEDITPQLLAAKAGHDDELDEYKSDIDHQLLRLERLRQKVRENIGIFEFMKEFQHTRSVKLDFDDFKVKLMDLVCQIEGFEGLEFTNLSDMTEDVWNDNSYKTQRKQKLGQLACEFVRHLDGECSHASCGRRVADYSLRASGGFNLDHQNPSEKNGNPIDLAKSDIMKLVDEILDETNGLLVSCPFHHDRGGHRETDLLDEKRIRLLKTEPSKRDKHRTPKDIFTDPKLRLKFTCYMIDSYIRGSHSSTLSYDFESQRVLDWAYFGVLADDFTRNSAHRWNSDNNQRGYHHQQSNRHLMNLIIFHSNCCRGAFETVGKSSDEFVCKDSDYDFRNISPLELYAIDGDHHGGKSQQPSDLVHGNSIVMINELCSYITFTCKFCHHIRSWHQRKGTQEPCYHTEEHRHDNDSDEVMD